MVQVKIVPACNGKGYSVFAKAKGGIFRKAGQFTTLAQAERYAEIYKEEATPITPKF